MWTEASYFQFLFSIILLKGRKGKHFCKSNSRFMHTQNDDYNYFHPQHTKKNKCVHFFLSFLFFSHLFPPTLQLNASYLFHTFMQHTLDTRLLLHIRLANKFHKHYGHTCDWQSTFWGSYITHALKSFESFQDLHFKDVWNQPRVKKTLRIHSFGYSRLFRFFID